MSAPQAVLDSLAKLEANQTKMQDQLNELAKPGSDPAVRGAGPYTGFSIRKGEDPLSSRGYSFQRMAALCGQQIERENCKLELDTHERLKKLYCEHGYEKIMPNSVLVPFSSELLAVSMGEEKFASEMAEVVKAGVAGYNPEEVRALRAKHWGITKALSWQDETQGGALVAPAAMGELIDLLRNNEVLMQAGARLLPMPPQGRLTIPRQTGAATAYFVGESTAITASNPTTGDVVLQAKKLGVLSKLPNELFRFAAISIEQFIREDLARVAALRLDKALLEDAGSATTPKGLINYAGINAYPSTGVATDGNVFSPEDVSRMVGTVESQNAVFKSWIMRPMMWSGVVNRRADAVSAGDQKGPFVFNVWRELQANFNLERQMPGNLYGYPVYKSTQIANNRAKGAGTALTYVLGGDFNDYLIAMSGVMEFAVSTQGDTPFTTDQTWLRATTYVDGAPRHEASFALCDTLVEG